MSATNKKLLWVAIFGVAFAFVESSVVVYLRSLLYPGGFEFPLKQMGGSILGIEMLREVSTIIVISAVAILAGSRAWDRFGYFLLAFGTWDLFYYVWLKVMLDWPRGLGDWDILFLVPLPWIGPVAAAGSVAGAMVVLGSILVMRRSRGRHFRPDLLSWALGVAGAAVILYSFMYDTGATLGGRPPAPYLYGLLVVGIALFGGSFVSACRTSLPGGASRRADPES